MVVDVQERIDPAMCTRTHLPRIRALVEGFRELELPVIATEQYPRGLGPTVPELAAVLPRDPVVKTTFSCALEPSFARALEEARPQQVVVTGIETHVCVLQTALDLLHAGLQVQVPYDAVASRRGSDRDAGLRRLERAGVVVTTTESVLFELVECAGTDRFRAISRIVKAIG